ncbi:hypothetical protein [Anoxybacterium hadale]|uniref:hypothetical protein n=1 Tax=Anoxybacterium hadale TaxID=3408580 RepID=UPI003B009095
MKEGLRTIERVRRHVKQEVETAGDKNTGDKNHLTKERKIVIVTLNIKSYYIYMNT